MNKTEVWKNASEIYAEISELSPQAALAYVNELQNITQDVRKAVITLISAGSQASAYFHDNISPSFDFGINNQPKYQTGQQLDEYELLEELGQGGMSQVFKAQRVDADVQTFVAIKIFSPRDSNPELLKHFINEQNFLAELSHPFIIKMFHGGMTKEGIAYLVMELVEDAQAIDVFCQKNKSSTKQKIRLIKKCASALAYSHANLIIHRDLKPDNILINAYKQPKVVDFGIAKLINKDISGKKTTIMALTPSYAAPEQINSQNISVKTDIFSLAVVAFDLLLDDNPLPKDRLLKSCANDEEFIDNNLKKLTCDKDLKNILRKALAINPDKRYDNMQSFADDLHNWLQGNPVIATSQSRLYRIRKFITKHSALSASVLTFFVFLIIASILGYKQYQQIKHEATKAAQVKQILLDAYAQTNPDFAKGRSITAKDILDYTAKTLKDKNLDSDTKFELLQTIGIAYGQIGKPQQAADYLSQSLKIKPDDEKSIVHNILYLNMAEKWHELEPLLQSVDVESMQDAKQKTLMYHVMAKIASRQSKFEQAHSYINKAIELDSKHNNKKAVIASKRLMAELYFKQSKPQKAIELLEKILENKQAIDSVSLVLGLQSDLATMYVDIGKYDKAEKQWLEVLQLQKKILGDDHLEIAHSLLQYAGTLRYLGKSKQAKEAIEQAHAINVKNFGTNSMQAASSLNPLAIMSYQTGDFKKAIELMTKTV
ncbi:MAG TPA: tetratricopeptide repeat protein, partial [Oceanospirillales bacterium]|nr:tetratricopeptide repeat protein [Oceanospirillales bacterium]